MTLGSYPSHRYYRSWITQRLVNRAPEFTMARKLPWSLSQQFLNPMSIEIQETYQQLADARYNMFVSTANINLLDKLYRVDLTNGMEFSSTNRANGEPVYTPPTVYATIDNIEHQITIAENNDIETLGYDCLPSRIEDGESSFLYQEVIPRTEIGSLALATPSSIVIDGHLYITIRNNTTWENRALDQIYYPKCYITGTTRKGTEVTESIPLRYNGTFKTVNEWQEVDSVFVSYLDSDATITIETFPWDTEGFLDTRNIYVPDSGGERIGFLNLGSTSYGSILSYETFTSANMDIVRTGLTEKETFYRVELLNDLDANVNINGFVPVPFTRFIYAVDDTNLYVYDTNFPYPDLSEMNDDEEAKIEICSDRWVYARGDTVKLKTLNRAVGDVPYKNRWKMTTPSGTEYYVALDGTLLPSTSNDWIENTLWDEAGFREQEIEITVSASSTYIIALESYYIDEDTNITTLLTTKYLVYVPAINPEVTIALPTGLTYPDDISIDSDGNVWLKKYGSVYKLDVFHDYFIVDYIGSRIWLRENYSSVRVVI